MDTIQKQLYYYCKYGNLEEIKSLNLTLKNIRHQDNEAFRWASKFGHLEIIKYLIYKGLTLDDIRCLDNFAFRWASIKGHFEVVKYLINQGLTLEDVRSQNNTAFEGANYNKHIEIVKYLKKTIKELKKEHKIKLKNLYIDVI